MATVESPKTLNDLKERFAKGKIGSETYAELMVVQPPAHPALTTSFRDRFTTPEEMAKAGRLPKPSELAALVGPRPDGTRPTYEDLYGMVLVEKTLPEMSPIQANAEFLSKFGSPARPPSRQKTLDSGGIHVQAFTPLAFSNRLDVVVPVVNN